MTPIVLQATALQGTSPAPPCLLIEAGELAPAPQVPPEETFPVTEGAEGICLPHGTPAPPGCEWVPLRQAHALLSPTDYALAARAAHLLHWNTHSRHCPRCGAANEPLPPYAKRCPQCGLEQFPSVVPAVIVRIERNDPDPAILLVHARNFSRPDYYGLVAGFVEPGESAEQAIRREVAEETALTLNHLRYFASQHWPFPQQLMLAFTAQCPPNAQPQCNDGELTHTLWATRDDILSGRIHIPDHASIARQLIDDWTATT